MSLKCMGQNTHQAPTGAVYSLESVPGKWDPPSVGLSCDTQQEFLNWDP